METLSTNQDNAHNTRYIKALRDIPALGPAARALLEPVALRYAFRSNDYYLGLIDWADPADPIRRLIIPRPGELDGPDDLDPCGEADFTVARGIQHKYPHTALVLAADSCGGLCRYCFRKRLFLGHNREVAHDFDEAVEYVARHREITNVLLTGGDPLTLPTARLADLLERLRRIDHVKIIRIGSKMPAFDPRRITADAELHDVLRRLSLPNRRIHLMAHFDHPRELTAEAVEAVATLIRCGVICVNQCPLLRGVNDSAETLVALFRKLSSIGCPQYYLFQGRPTAGNRPFRVPIVRGWELFNEAVANLSGLSKRARLVMSHHTGKIEIVAVDQQFIYMRYHRRSKLASRRPIMIYHRDDEACWLNDLTPVGRLTAVEHEDEIGAGR